MPAPNNPNATVKPYGTKPSTLPNPVPPDAEANALLSEMGAYKGTSIPSGRMTAPLVAAEEDVALESLTGDPELDALIAETNSLLMDEEPSQVAQSSAMPFGGQGPGFPEAPDLGPEYEPEPNFLQANIDQFRNIGDRFKAGLAANDSEVMNLLRGKYGEDNVRFKNGKPYFRKAAGEKFRALDPDQFELFADIIPDMGRAAIQEAALLPAEIGGALAAGPAGAAAARAAATPLAITASDKAARAAGVPEDEGRSFAWESGLQMAAEAALPIAGRLVSRFTPGLSAYNAAKKAGEKELTALSRESQQIAQNMNVLREANQAVTIGGEAVGVPGGQVDLTAYQAAPESSKLKKLNEIASEYTPYVNAVRQQGEAYGRQFTAFINDVAKRGAKGKVIPGDDQLAKKVVDAVNNVRKIEGENLAGYKAKALKNLGMKEQPLSEGVLNQINRMAQATGYDPAKGATKEQLQGLVGKFGITSIGEARAISNTFSDVMNSFQRRGGMNINDLDRLRNSVGALSEKMRGTEAGRELAILSRELRQNYRQAIEGGIHNEFEKLGFQSAMDDYSNIMDNLDFLRGSLNDKASVAGIVSTIFTGKENLSRVRAIKALSPEAWDGLKSEWLSQQLEKFSTRDGLTGIQSGKFLDSLNKQYGDAFLKEVMDPADLKTTKAFLSVMERLDKTFSGEALDRSTDQAKQNAINTVVGLVGDVRFKWMNGLTGFLKGKSGAENAAITLLTRDGIDKYVANYPGKIDKAMTAQRLKDFVAKYRVDQMLERIIPPVGRVTSPTQSAARSVLRPQVDIGSGTVEAESD